MRTESEDGEKEERQGGGGVRDARRQRERASERAISRLGYLTDTYTTTLKPANNRRAGSQGRRGCCHR